MKKSSALAATIHRQYTGYKFTSSSAKDMFQLYLSCRFEEGPPFLVHEVHEHLINALCAEAYYNYKSKLEEQMLFILLYHFLSLFHLQT